MNEWVVFGVIVTVAGFLAVVVPPIIKLTSSITKLTTVVDNLGKEMEKQQKQNKTSVDKLWSHNDEQDGRINDHETRLRLLEESE